VETATSESVRREEFRRGIQEGKRLTEAALKAEYEERLEQERHRVDNVLAAFTEQLSSIQGAAEQAVIKFAFGIAEKIIRKEITEDRQIVVEQIKEGVRRVVGVENVRVRIHPEDLPLVRDQRPVIQGSGDAIREIVLDGDDSLERGDCIIESDMGNIDARVATQLRQIEMVLFEGRLRS
jgi:flagellar biosynthesis/type III secretory pathway protein FliH